MQAVAGADVLVANEVVCVSGAAGAIGAATCARFAREGALVVAVDQSPTVYDLAQRIGPFCEPVLADLSSDAGADAVRHALLDLGGVDHVISVAGGALSDELAATDVDAIDAALFSRSLDANLVSAWRFVRASLPALRTSRSPLRSVMLCSSRNAIAGHGLISYSAAKAGLLGMMHPLAVALGPEGIRVNAVLPGQIATPYAVALHADQPGHFERVAAGSALGRLATEQDCADAFWALSRLGAVSGQALVVDGGAHIWRSA